MDTLTPPTPSPMPQPGTETAPTVAPAAVPVAETPVVRPGCDLCGADARVQWQRRPTDEELVEIRAIEDKRRALARKLADLQGPEPVFPPLPTTDDTLRTVPACAAHAITLEAAARIHASSCTAPNDADLPGCDCTPQALPTARLEDEHTPDLPAHWTTGGQ